MRKTFLLLFGMLISIISFSSFAVTTDSEGYPVVYLRGGFNNTGWQADSKYKFTRSGNVYTLTINNSNAIGNCQFKIGDDDWSMVDLGGGMQINASQYATLQRGGSDLQTNGLNNAVISFTYVPNAASTTVKFVIDGVEPLPQPDPGDDDGSTPVYLRGDFNGTSWMKVDSRYRFTKSGDTYTLKITPSNPITAGSSFKIASEDWTTIDFGGTEKNIFIDNTQNITLKYEGENLSTNRDITSGSISFTLSGGDLSIAPFRFVIDGTDEVEKPVTGLSGTLPVLYINVYGDKDHTFFNNEIISKDLNHKNYFEFAEYWLDVNGCQWLEDLGAENIGSKEKPLALQIKARGNWTMKGFSKKPFKLKLDKKQSLLGLSKSKHFAILAHADDNGGYLRNFIGFNLGRRIGLPWTPTHQPVEVVINGDYRGLYFLTESIRVDADRVNIQELEDNVDDPKLASGGYIVELDNYDEDSSAQIQMDEKVNPAVGGHYVDKLRITFDTPEVYSDLQRRFITDQFTAINNYVGSNNDALWSYLDLDDAARYYLVEEIVSHTESYHGSTYLFRDRGANQKWHFSPLWDFGNAFNGRTDDYFYNCDPFGNTWIPSIRQNDKFNNKVKDTWLWFMQNKYNGLINDIDEYVGHLTTAAKADHERWKSAPVPNGGQSVANNSDMQGKRNQIVDHLNAKINWLKGKFGDYTRGTYTEPARDTTAAAALPDYLIDTAVVDFIDDNDEAPAEYFNLQGIVISRPAPGTVCIERRGTQTRKVIVK